LSIGTFSDTSEIDTIIRFILLECKNLNVPWEGVKSSQIAMLDEFWWTVMESIQSLDEEKCG
jgi:hypothetical protein